MSNGLVKKEDVTKFSNQIYSESKRLMTLIDDIIKLSFLDEDNNDSVDYKDVDVYKLCESVNNDLALVAKNSNVNLSLKGDHFITNSSSRLLYMVIYNLVDNAIKYNRPGGYVDVSVSNEGIIKVKDNGIGIPEESIDRIFERFYRVDKSHSKEVGGTGLGLSIVKHAVMTLGGDISLKSKLNEGSEFTIVLPKL